MSKKLYVGNLAYSVRDDDLQQHFNAFGTVESAKVMMERDTGRSKGFGFVEMSTAEEAQAAIEGSHGKNMGGRDGGYGGGNGGGGYGGGGYGGGRRNSY